MMMIALPAPRTTSPNDKKTEQEARALARERVLLLTVREGPNGDDRWHHVIMELEEKQVRTVDGRLVTLKGGRRVVCIHVDNFVHWGERGAALSYAERWMSLFRGGR